MLVRSLFVESKKLRVFDFDDTLVKTTSFIYVTNKGKTRKLTPGQYAVYKEKPGDEFDFKDFQNIEPKPLSKDKFNILFIGSVTDRKKPHMIIEAIQRINDKSYNLSIVGPAPNEKYFKELKDLIDKSDLQNQVSLIGPVDRESVKDYYSTSNLMILPSVSEGLARVIFESQVAMCPVLVTDAPGMSDIVIDGQTGYVFESNNLDSLSLKIEYIKNNYEEASLVAKNAKGFILSNYSEDNFKFSFKKLFDTV